MLIEVQRRLKLPNTEKANIQMLQTLLWARHSPKSVQLHSCGWEPSAGPSWEKDVSGKSLGSWWPDCSCAMALRDEIWTEKDLHWLPLGLQSAHLGISNHPCGLLRIGTNSGKPCALEGSSVPICVHWKSRENYFRTYSAAVQALRVVPAYISEVFCRCPDLLCKAVKSQQYQTCVKPFRHYTVQIETLSTAH